MRKVQVVTSKESKSGAMLTYVSDVEIKGGKMILSNSCKVSYQTAHSIWAASSEKPEVYGVVVWAIMCNENEVEEKVMATIEKMTASYRVEEYALPAAEVEVEEVAAVEVTVAAATFETVEVKAVEVIATGNITVSKFGVFYKAVKIFSRAIKLAAISKNVNNSNDFNNICKAIKLAAISKNVNNSNDFNNICKAIKLAAISKNVNNFKNISSGGGVAKVFNLAAEIEKLKAGGVSIRGSPQGR